MGRELKRVPLDFDHPLKTRWPGYIRKQQPDPCKHCHGTGWNLEGHRLQNEWYGWENENSPPDEGLRAFLGVTGFHRGPIGTFDPAAYGSKPYTLDTPGLRDLVRDQLKNAAHHMAWKRLVAAGDVQSVFEKPAKEITDDQVTTELSRLIAIWNRRWSCHLIAEDVKALVDEGRLREFAHRQPTPEQVNLWSLGSMGHSSIDVWICIKARAEREGINIFCEHCGGEGTVFANDDEKLAYESWEPTDPPVGDGYQLWENVSEGSPVSPVFDSLEG